MWIIVCVVWTCFPLAAQVNNYQLASLRTTSGEARQAWINEESDLLLSKGLSVRQTPDGTSVLMEPQDVAEVTFSQSGRRFHPVQHTYVPTDADTPVEETRLALLLLDGPVALYRLNISTDEFYKMESDIPPIAYYLRTEPGAFVKLEVREIDIVDPQSAASFKVRAAYKDVLRYLWREWPAVEQALRRTDFRDQELVELVERYIAFKYGTTAKTATSERVRSRLQHLVQFNLAPSPRFLDRTDLPASWGGGYYLKFNNASVDNALAWGLGVEYLGINFPDWPRQAGEYLLTGRSFRLPFLAEYYLTRNPNKLQLRFKALMIPAWQQFDGARYRPGSGENAVPARIGDYAITGLGVYFGVGVGADMGRWRVDVQYETATSIQATIGYYLRK